MAWVRTLRLEIGASQPEPELDVAGPSLDALTHSRPGAAAPPLDTFCLRDTLMAAFRLSLPEAFSHVPGLSVRSGDDAPATDAVMNVTVDRCGVRVRLRREAWMRATATLRRSGSVGETRIAVVGSAGAFPSLLRRGASRSDERLAREAAADAARRLRDAAVLGSIDAMAEDCRVLYVPVVIPRAATASGVDRGVRSLRVDGLLRRADVMFRPDPGPAATIVSRQQGLAALQALDLTPEDFWEPGNAPNGELLRGLARESRADHIFMGLVESAAVCDTVRDGGDGVQRTATVAACAAWYDASLGRIVWTGRSQGETRAYSEVVRGARRLRGESDALTDAAVAAFSSLVADAQSARRRDLGVR